MAYGDVFGNLTVYEGWLAADHLFIVVLIAIAVAAIFYPSIAAMHLFSHVPALCAHLALGQFVLAAPSSDGQLESLARTRKFKLHLTWREGAPDGFKREMIYVNGQFPAPALNIDQGDAVEIVIQNDMPFGTAIHFHGIEQLGTPWSDGVPGVTQELIPPGKKFTYRWTANDFGTFWYHAHARGQFTDGLFGPIGIRPVNGTPTPFRAISNDTKALAQLAAAEADPKILMVSDWSHFTSEELRDISMAANIDAVCMDSILVNGKGSVKCESIEFLMSFVPPPLLQSVLLGQNLTSKGCPPVTNAVFQGNYVQNFDLVPDTLFDGCKPTTGQTEVVQVDATNGWASINFVNSASSDELTVSIDNHPMWVYAVDGAYVVPQKVQSLTTIHGSRYATLIQLDQPALNYTIRIACSSLNQKVAGIATLAYKGSTGTAPPAPSIDYGGANTSASVVPFKDLAALPYFPQSVPVVVDATHVLVMQRVQAAWTWSLNNNAVFGSPLERVTPLLYAPNSAKRNLTIATVNGTWVDLVLVSLPLGPSHPIHKHSSRGYVVGYGVGPWNYSSVADAAKVLPAGTFNFENPPVRDTVYTPPALTEPTWIVLRYHVRNPGAFLIHCHINPHLTGGMAIALLDGVDKFPAIPKEYALRER